MDRLIDKLKTDPSIEAVYNDTIITGDQSTSPVIVLRSSVTITLHLMQMVSVPTDLYLIMPL